MIVVCLEGCHGSGKTQLCRQFAAAGFEVLDEAFMDQPEYALHPQSLVMETYWVAHWFQRLLKRQYELKQSGGNPHRIFIADRSPFSAVFYGKNGHLLESVIRQQVVELKEQADVEVVTVSIQVSKELLWRRIQERLRKEPERKKYNEDRREWMETTLDWYHSFKWDFVAENNELSINEVMHQLIAQLSATLPSWSRSISGRTRIQAAPPISFEEEVLPQQKQLEQDSPSAVSVPMDGLA